MNLFHLHLEAGAEALTGARDRIAGESGVWLAPRFSADRGPGRASAEIYVGDAMLVIAPENDRGIFAPLYARLLEIARSGVHAGVHKSKVAIFILLKLITVPGERARWKLSLGLTTPGRLCGVVVEKIVAFELQKSLRNF